MSAFLLFAAERRVGEVDFGHLPPEQLADDILKKEQRIAELMLEIKAVLTEKP